LREGATFPDGRPCIFQAPSAAAAVSAPSLREVALEQPDATLPFAEALGEGRIDVVVRMTGSDDAG
jgi:hypothetical protein